MKVIRLLTVFLAVIVCVSSLFLSLYKSRTITSFEKDKNIIASYKKWGLDVRKYEAQIEALLIKSEHYSIFLFPFQSKIIQAQKKYIVSSALQDYVTEVNNGKQTIDLKLTYLRDRLKVSLDLNTAQKDKHFASLDGIAVQVFEKEPTLIDIKKAIQHLQQVDEVINQEIETNQKNAVFTEIDSYKLTCEELKIFFESKNNIEGISTANRCIDEGEKLRMPQYQNNSVSYIEAIAREKVFTLLQKAQDLKSKVLEQEHYALQKQKKDAEYLAIIPPAPEQNGKIIVVNLQMQRLYAYENGVSIYPNAVLITSGKQGFETITGRFAIYLKERFHKMQSPFPGIYYDNVVEYWMPFFSGYGLHDASWRHVYGTFDYLSVGSHGCINMPLNDAALLYNWVEVGTTVIVQ